MKKKWMNTGFEDDELEPYLEPVPDLIDPVRISEYSNCLFIDMIGWFI